MAAGFVVHHKYCGQWLGISPSNCQACQDAIVLKRLHNRIQPVPLCKNCNRDVFDDESVLRCAVCKTDYKCHKGCSRGWKVDEDRRQTCPIHSETNMDTD